MIPLILFLITLTVGMCMVITIPSGREFWQLSQDDFNKRMRVVHIGMVLSLISPLVLLFS